MTACAATSDQNVSGFGFGLMLRFGHESMQKIWVLKGTQARYDGESLPSNHSFEETYVDDKY